MMSLNKILKNKNKIYAKNQKNQKNHIYVYILFITRAQVNIERVLNTLIT